MECERFRPHVMLYELSVSDDDGRQICDLIRGNEELQVTRIIAMSSRVTDGQVSQLQQCGFDSVLRKPFTVRQVIEAVEAAHAVIY